MIEAVSTTARIQRAYDFLSRFYWKVGDSLDDRPRMLGLEKVDISPQDRVLEVAVGPGKVMLEITKRADRTNVVHGIDLSIKMLERARKLIAAAGYQNFELRQGDARELPYADKMFDVVYNSYMIDLLKLHEISEVLNEFHRVLKPDGRLVLVNMSKLAEGRLNFWERFYKILPASWVPFVLGGCRPVLVENLVKDAGFREVKREFVRNVISSEIVTARRAIAEGI